MAKQITTETTCDLCGATSTKTSWEHELPGIGFNFGTDATNYTTASFSPPREDYCDVCVEYVGVAIMRAKDERRAVRT